MSNQPRTLGQIAFEAYNGAGKAPGFTYDGEPVPTWENLSEDVRAKWEAGAQATGAAFLAAFQDVQGDGHVQFAYGRAVWHFETACATNSAPLTARLFLTFMLQELANTDFARRRLAEFGIPFPPPPPPDAQNPKDA